MESFGAQLSDFFNTEIDLDSAGALDLIDTLIADDDNGIGSTTLIQNRGVEELSGRLDRLSTVIGEFLGEWRPDGLEKSTPNSRPRSPDNCRSYPSRWSQLQHPLPRHKCVPDVRCGFLCGGCGKRHCSVSGMLCSSGKLHSENRPRSHVNRTTKKHTQSQETPVQTPVSLQGVCSTVDGKLQMQHDRPGRERFASYLRWKRGYPKYSGSRSQEVKSKQKIQKTQRMYC